MQMVNNLYLAITYHNYNIIDSDDSDSNSGNNIYLTKGFLRTHVRSYNSLKSF